MDDYRPMLAWVDSWKSLQDPDIVVLWDTRRWSRVGEQRVPVRASVSGPDAIARVAGVKQEWRRWRGRANQLIDALGDTSELRAAIASNGRAIGSLPQQDFERLLLTTQWLLENPTSGMFIRELPIRGIDTKWLGNHRGLVQTLLGRKDFGLRTPPETVRVRFLDPILAPSRLTDLDTPLDQLNSLDPPAVQVLVVENLQTFLALPPMAGVIAVDGHGDKAQVLSQVDWIRRAHCVYWGDLDSHGFRILSRTRQSGLTLDSCLMDTSTLLAFQDLWVQEPKPFRGELPGLTEAENKTFAVLQDRGYPRLEQERIEWGYAVSALNDCLHSERV